MGIISEKQCGISVIHRILNRSSNIEALKDRHEEMKSQPKSCGSLHSQKI